VGAWLARGTSRGRRRPSPTRFRRWAHKPPKTAGGLADIERGLRRKGLWTRARNLDDLTREQMRGRFLADSGKLYAAETDFNVWPEHERCQPDFGDQPDAYHMVGIVAGEGNGGKVRVMDPLCGRMSWVDVDDVLRAILEYNREHGEGRTGDLIVVVPPNRPVVEVPPDAPDEPDDDPEPADLCADMAANSRAAGRESAFVQVLQSVQALRSTQEE
jgi:hypothetical protein